MADLLELGRYKVYRGPPERKPREWDDQSPPVYARAGDEPGISDQSRGTFPRAAGRRWLIEALDIGPNRADILTRAEDATVIDFRRNGKQTRAILRWTVGKELTGRQSEGAIVTEAYGFVILSDAQADILCRMLREARAPAKDLEQDAVIEAALRVARLAPDQVEERRREFLKAHGLDDETVGKQRASVIARALAQQALKKP